jgi:hypothetical protein
MGKAASKVFQKAVEAVRETKRILLGDDLVDEANEGCRKEAESTRLDLSDIAKAVIEKSKEREKEKAGNGA